VFLTWWAHLELVTTDVPRAVGCDAGHKGQNGLDEICRVISQLAPWDPLKRPSHPHPP
jgi:hypothetical protein